MATGEPDRAGHSVHHGRLGDARAAGERSRYRVGPAHLGLSTHAHRCVVGAQDDVGIEQGDQRTEVTTARRGEEGLDDRPLARSIRFVGGLRAPHPAPSAARELARRSR